VAHRAIDAKADYPNAWAYLAAAAANAGEMGKARTAIAEFHRLLPKVTLQTFRDEKISDRPAFLAQREHFYDGLRKAGLPD
jgi:hypothetical protein